MVNDNKIKNIDFNNSNTNNLHTVNLFNWTGRDGRDFIKSEDELRETFLNLDKSMRYLHDNNYYISSFNPYDIDLVDGSNKLIRFNYFDKIENDYEKTNIVKDDIFNCACLQLGLYLHELSSLDDVNKIKNNFDELSSFLPASDVGYFRGVIVRGASVYYSDFAAEKSKRDLATLAKELSDGKEDVQTEEIHDLSEAQLSNKNINDALYQPLFEKKKIYSYRNAAFIHVLLFPTIILTLLILFSIISFIFSFI